LTTPKVYFRPGTGPWNPVCGHRRADAAPAEQDAALGPVLAQSSTHRLCVVGTVHRIGAMPAQVEDVAMLSGQENFDRLLQCKSGMI
jgi:hypothetical protein